MQAWLILNEVVIALNLQQCTFENYSFSLQFSSILILLYLIKTNYQS